MNNVGVWQIVFYAAIIFGGAIVKWIGTRLKEQNARKQSDESAAASREESLRTGKSVAEADSRQAAPSTATLASPSDPQARLRELAMQRQEQLRKLRERGQQAGAGGSLAVPAPTTMSRPAPAGQLWPGGPPVTARPSTPRSSSAPRPVAVPMEAPRPSKRDVDLQRERSAEARRRQQQAAQARRMQADAERQRMTADQSRRTAAARIAGIGATEERFESDPTTREARWGTRRESSTSAAWTPERLRDAFVLSEVIGPPVALRE